jgi:MFS family permease
MASTFRSLRYRNARLFFVGMLVSNIGTWMQFTAVAILVDRITGRTTAIGVLTALQFLPMLLLGAYGGAIADQRDRRRLSIITQSGLAAQAVALAVLDLTGTISLGIIYALTLVLGIVSAFDNPARRGFVTELVPREDVANAISLNTATMTSSRIFGPAVAGLLIGPLGTGWLFTINALSFVAILGSLFLIDRATLYPAPLARRGGTPVRDGLRFIRRSNTLFVPFIVFAVVSTFGFTCTP